MVEVGLDLVEEEWSHEVENNIQNHLEKHKNKKKKKSFNKKIWTSMAVSFFLEKWMKFA